MPGVHDTHDHRPHADEDDFEPRDLVAMMCLHALLRNTSTRGIPPKEIVANAFKVAAEFHKQKRERQEQEEQ